MRYALVALVPAVAVAIVLPLLAAGSSNAKEETDSLMPPLAPEHAAFGRVFTVADEKKRDTVTFRSSAPLEDIVGTTSEIRGYVAFDPERPDRGIRGDFRVPVASLNTGIPLRDEHLRSPTWLHAEEHPHLRFRIDGSEKVKLLKEGDGFKTWELEATGEFEVRGRSKPQTAKVRLTYLEESEKTRTRLPGDLLAGRAEFTLPIGDFGIEGLGRLAGSKVSEEIEIRVSVMGSTVLEPNREKVE
jgi:polyisoprenoid-binding protein YceI